MNVIGIDDEVNEVIRTEQARLIKKLKCSVSVSEAIRSLLGLDKEKEKK